MILLYILKFSNLFLCYFMKSICFQNQRGRDNYFHILFLQVGISNIIIIIVLLKRKFMSQHNNQLLLQQPPIFLKNIGNSQIDLSQEQIQSDMRSIQNLLTNFTESAKQTNEKISQLTELIQQNHEINSVQDNTPSFYAYKNLLLNQYLVTLKFYELFRLNGVNMTSGTGLQLYQKLFYLKTILIKLAPIDKKLEYQRDRLLSRSSKIKNIKKVKPQQYNEQNEADELLNDNSSQDEEADESPEQNELIYRPNVQQLLKSSKNVNNKKSQQKQEKYVAPKLSSVLPEDQKRKQKLEKQKQRRKAMLLRKFRGDIQQDDNVEEMGIQSNIYSSYKKKYEEKQQFELDNFVRLPETKKQKQEKKRLMKNQFKGNQLNDQFKETQLIRELVQNQMNKKDIQGGFAEGSMPKKRRKIK